MGQLITDLLDLSRTGRVELKRSWVDLIAIVQRVKDELLIECTDTDLTLKIGKLPEVLADETLIYQVILNLLSNAVKFSSRKEQAIIEIGSFNQENNCVYFVKDNGVGFDMKYAEKTFEVFHRLHSAEDFSGTGIGLAIVKRIITMHNGNIWVESEIGKGTTFFFTISQNLPLKK
jgi:light-regulated signal transduction histidine kinase (bacteriophytochrome)